LREGRRGGCLEIPARLVEGELILGGALGGVDVEGVFSSRKARATALANTSRPAAAIASCNRPSAELMSTLPRLGW
jgi:hypothetical protein